MRSNSREIVEAARPTRRRRSLPWGWFVLGALTLGLAWVLYDSRRREMITGRVTQLGGKEVTARMRSDADVKPGQTMPFAFNLDKAVVFDPASGRSLGTTGD